MQHLIFATLVSTMKIQIAVKIDFLLKNVSFYRQREVQMYHSLREKNYHSLLSPKDMNAVSSLFVLCVRK